MNKLILLLCFIAASSLSAQSLCYQMEHETRVRVTQDLNTETLNILDKLLFLKKSYTKTHKLQLLDNNWKQEVQLIKQKNVFPKWYVPPTKVVQDHQGTRSYFANDNKLLSKGWAGAYSPQSTSSAYVARTKNEERHYVHQMDDKALQSYTNKLLDYKSGGLLIDFLWKTPSSAELEQFRSKGYTIETTSMQIKVTSTTQVWKWNLVDKIREEIVYGTDGLSVLKQTRVGYTYNKIFKEYLKATDVTFTPSHFSNGDCYDLVVVNHYSDFSDCDPSSITVPRSSVDATAEEISIFPNPVAEQLNVELVQGSSSHISLKVCSMDGAQYLMRKMQVEDNKLSVNVATLPKGMYILTIDIADQSFNQKFVKL